MPLLQGKFRIHKSIKVIKVHKQNKEKYHRIISMNVERALDEIQNSSIIKKTQEIKIQEDYLKMV